MTRKNSLRKLIQEPRPANRPAARKRSPQPALEALEDRSCPSGVSLAAPITLPVGANPDMVTAYKDPSNGQQYVLVANGASNTISEFQYQGNGNFLQMPTINLPAWTSTITGSNLKWLEVGDFNNDGKLDIIAANPGQEVDFSGHQNFGAPGAWYFLPGTSAGHFGSAVTLPLPTDSAGNVVAPKPYAVTSLDLNHDGNLDLVMTTMGAGKITVLDGNGGQGGQLQFTVRQVLETTIPSGNDAWAYMTNLRHEDVNGDGIPDIEVSAAENNVQPYGPGGFVTYLGNPDGTFQAGVFRNDPNGNGFRSADYIESGHYEGPSKPVGFAITNGNGGDLFPAVTFYQGNGTGSSGNGTFQPAVEIGTGASAGFDNEETVDLNGDGNDDLIVTNGANNTMSVLLSNGDGTFAPPVMYPTGNAPNFVDGDLTSDNGLPALIVANGNDNTISVFLNTTSTATAPSITQQPTSETVTAGQSPTFSVAATGTGPLSYQWQKLIGGTWTNIAGATAPTFTIMSAQAADAGQYWVVVSNSAGQVVSNSVSLTVTPPVQTPGVFIAAGESSPVGNFAADEDFNGTGLPNGPVNVPIDTSGVSNAAPQAVYQSFRNNDPTYVIPNLTPGASYHVRLDFAELIANGEGQRVFNVSINGTQVLTNFDPFKAAGDKMFKAVAEDFIATATDGGQITITFTTVVGNSRISGIEITPAPRGTQSVFISAGDPNSVGNFSADKDFTGGALNGIPNQPIDTSGVTNPAPQQVYDWFRNSDPTYTIPNLTPGAAYHVRLDFAEIVANGPGQRVFNVGINGNQVLSNFDIFATAGGMNKAVAEDFTAFADANGQITITLTTVIGNSRISGIEVTPG
jgi:hypothetical protein